MNSHRNNRILNSVNKLHNYSIELYVSVESKIKDNRVELKKEIDINKLKAND